MFLKCCSTGKIAADFITLLIFGFQTMLRLTDIKLPLNHQADAIEQAILKKLAITKDELVDFSIFKRGYDARKKK